MTENLSAMAGMKWITRVPLSIKTEIKSQEKPVKKTKKKLEESRETQTIVYQVTGKIEPRNSAIENALDISDVSGGTFSDYKWSEAGQ
jgi:hypothetical protein